MLSQYYTIVSLRCTINAFLKSRISFLLPSIFKDVGRNESDLRNMSLAFSIQPYTRKETMTSCMCIIQIKQLTHTVMGMGFTTSIYTAALFSVIFFFFGEFYLNKNLKSFCASVLLYKGYKLIIYIE